MQEPFHQPGGAESPRRIEDLPVAERLLLRAFRRWVAGLSRNDGQQWAFVATDFREHFDPDQARDAMAALAALVRATWAAARRPIACHPPCCAYVAADETLLVEFIGACQAGHWLLANTLAGLLLGAEGGGDLLRAAASLARTLEARGLLLSPPAEGSLGGRRRPEAPAVWH